MTGLTDDSFANVAYLRYSALYVSSASSRRRGRDRRGIASQVAARCMESIDSNRSNSISPPVRYSRMQPKEEGLTEMDEFFTAIYFGRAESARAR